MMLRDGKKWIWFTEVTSILRQRLGIDANSNYTARFIRNFRIERRPAKYRSDKFIYSFDSVLKVVSEQGIAVRKDFDDFVRFSEKNEQPTPQKWYERKRVTPIGDINPIDMEHVHSENKERMRQKLVELGIIPESDPEYAGYLNLENDDAI